MSATLTMPRTSYATAGPLPPFTAQTRILALLPESERAAFLSVAESVLLHHRTCDADRLGDDLYLAYEVIGSLALHYGDTARHEAAEWVMSALIADYEEAEDFCRWLLAERETRRRAKAAARKARAA